MSGETESNVSGWTVDTLRNHLLTLLENQRLYFERVLAEDARADGVRWADCRSQREDDRRMADSLAEVTSKITQGHLDSTALWQVGHERIHAVEKDALDKASVSMDKRLYGMNEFRGQLQDQARDFVGRAEFLSTVASAERATAVDHDRLADMVSRQEMSLQLDTFKGQINSLQKSITDVSQLMATVRSRDAGRSSGTSEAIDAADRAADAAARNRTLLLTTLSIMVAIAALVTGLYIGLRNHTNPTTPTTSTTTATEVPYAPQTPTFRRFE